MAKEPKICAYCNKEITKDQDDPQVRGDQTYHSDCFKLLEIDEHIAAIHARYPTIDNKLARIIAQNFDLQHIAENQRDHLGTIKTVLVLFMILVIAGIVLQSCSALF